MKSKRFLIILGTLISLILLIIVFSHLDWQAFFNSLKTIRPLEIVVAGLTILLIVALRALRWTLVAGMPLSKFKPFWQGVNIGYLGNLIYPARAGEVLRIVAVHHFVPLSIGRTVSSAVIDRMWDASREAADLQLPHLGPVRSDRVA